MYVPPESTSSTPAPVPEPEKPAERVPEREAEPVRVDVSAFVNMNAPTTPAPAKTYTRSSEAVPYSPSSPREDEEETDGADSEGTAAPASPKPAERTEPSVNLNSGPVAVTQSSILSTSSSQSFAVVAPVSPAPPAARDVRAELSAEPDSTRRYARLIELLESEPIPEPRVVAATFKEWFTKDAQFKAYFNALGAVRVASLLKNVANALKA